MRTLVCISLNLLAALVQLHVSRFFFDGQKFGRVMNVITKMNTKYAIPFEDVVINEGDALKIKVSHVRQLSSNALFGDAKEIVILHLNEAYVLSITKQKKLLLTKAKQDFAL